MTGDCKPTNPKDACAATTKLPLHLVPTSAVALVSLAFLHGARKYGSWNWRVAGVRASVYKGALDRHMAAWWEGQAHDPESGLPHLAHALACLMILVDADAAENLTDDRPPSRGVPEWTADLSVYVGRLLTRMAERPEPTHYTIQDVLG